jgi:hypothetical protein
MSARLHLRKVFWYDCRVMSEVKSKCASSCAKSRSKGAAGQSCGNRADGTHAACHGDSPLFSLAGHARYGYEGAKTEPVKWSSASLIFR